MKDNFEIWDFVSLAWTEIGPDENDYEECAISLRDKYDNWKSINKIILRDVCGSFSIESFTILLAFIPLIGLLLVTPMPGWGYDQEYLKNRMEKWGKSNIFLNYLNPFRIVGYPIALLFVLGLKNKLKKAYLRASSA